MAASLVGALIANRYRVVRALAEGGMGSVYVAVQESLGREIAIKVILGARESADEETRRRAQKRFEREAKVIAQLQHPNIVAFLDYGTLDDGRIFLAMEYAAGQTLKDCLRERAFSYAETVPIVSSVCSALWSAHKLGVVHRDIKHDNIVLVGERRIVKLLDFGIAKLVDAGAGSSDGAGPETATATATQSLTGTGVIIGSAGFIAPEILRGDEPDPRADLYSLGVVWWELLCRRRLFEGKDPMAIALKHAYDAPPPPTSRGVDMPPAAEQLLLQLLAKAPIDRPPNALDVVERLAALERQAPSTPFVPPAPPTRLAAQSAGDSVWGADTEEDGGAVPAVVPDVTRAGDGAERAEPAVDTSATVPLLRDGIHTAKTVLDD